MSTGEKRERTVCFSPEKHKLISEIQNQNTGCELKRFKRSGSNDIIINNNSSVKKIKVDFDRPSSEEVKVISIAEVLNEATMYEIVSVSGMLFDLDNEQSVFKDGNDIKFVTVNVADATDTIPITIYGNLISYINQRKVNLHSD